MAILLGIVVIDALLFFVLWFLNLNSLHHNRPFHGVPRPAVRGLLMSLLIGINGFLCGIFGLGGPQVQAELARRRALGNVTQVATASVDTHTCLLSVSYDAEIMYHFTAPDPATGRERTYRGRDRLRSSEGSGCGPVVTPYAQPIWYDPTNPQHSTIQPPRAGTIIMDVVLLVTVAGMFGVLPLAAVSQSLWSRMWLSSRAARSLRADVRQMEAAGFQIALDANVQAAAHTAEQNPEMAAYVRRLHGEVYISLDFITNPAERASAWNALWRVQAKGWMATNDETQAHAILLRLQGYPPPMDPSERLKRDTR
jgi:hypothetical protein